MHENFKHVQPTPLTKQEVAEDDEYVLWEKESLLSTDNMCGVGSCRGPALQGLASRKLYLFVFCGLCIVQGMYYSYVISVLTTIEKRFAVPSRITGLLMTGHEFSQVVFAVVVSYFGSQGHRPRWLALGMFVSAVACFVSALPEFIFPSLEAIVRHGDICLNHTAINITDPACSLPIPFASSRSAAAIIFLGLFFSGVGSITLYSLGLPYMDDNTSKKKSPAYIGIVAGLRMVGPTLGFFLGAYCTRQYVTLQDVRNLSLNDPRWIGAWWLGFAIIGLLLFLGGLLVAPFPKILPATVVKKLNEESHLNMDETGEMDYIPDIPAVPRLAELAPALWRLVSNPLFMIYTIGGIFHLIGTVGFFTFLPKYLEAQFRQTASSANMISGFAGFFVMMLSTIASGFIIQSWRPRARLLSGWMVVVTLIQVIGILVCMQITCGPSAGVQGIDHHPGQIDLNNECNNACHCTTKKFSPVCDKERKLSYFSACHLGCTNFNVTSQSYENCSCTTLNPKGLMPVVISNYCDSSCRAIILYISVLAFIKFCASSCHVGSILIALRCIEARDKGLAIGFLNTIYCLLAFLPCTIIYGALVDSACDVWEESCSTKGNCWVYDPERLRHLLHGVTAVFMSIGMLFHIYLCFQSKRLNLYEETISLSPRPVKLGDMTSRTN